MSGKEINVLAMFRIPDDCYLETGSSSTGVMREGLEDRTPADHVKIPPIAADTILDFTPPSGQMLRQGGGSDAIKARLDTTTMLQVVLAIANSRFNIAVAAANHKPSSETVEK